MATRKISLSNYKDGILRNLNKYRGSSRLCDVKVVAQGKQFPAHCAVLAASCEFFSALLDADMKEQQSRVIELSSIESETLELVLTFIYTGEIELTLDNAQAVLIAADFLLIDKLKVAVEDFMSKNAESFCTDILAIYQLASQYKCEKLKMESLKIILEKFEDVVHTAEFLQMNLESMVEILLCDDLKVSNEEVIYRAILNWINHKEDRKDSFFQLFSLVRLCSIQEEFLQNVVVQEKLVSGNPECLKLVLKSMRSKYIPTTANGQHPRECLDNYMNAILVFPTKHELGLPRTPWCYIPRKDRWCKLSVKNNHGDFGIGWPVYHNGVVFLVDNYSSSLSVQQYDLKSNRWSRSLCQSTVLSDVELFSVVCLKGVIYTIGGMREEQSMSLVISFDVAGPQQELTMKQMASMMHCRAMPSVVADEQYIYVFGGMSTQDTNQFVPSLERYNPQTNHWDEIAQLTFPPSIHFCQSALVNGKIYIVPTGLDLGSYVYDIQSSMLSQISKWPSFDVFGALQVCDNSLYLIGYNGFTGETWKTNPEHFKLSIHKFDSNTWAAISAFTSSVMIDTYVPVGGVTVRLPKSSLEKLKPL